MSPQSNDDIIRSMIGDLVLQIAVLRGRVAQLEHEAATRATDAYYAQSQETEQDQDSGQTNVSPLKRTPRRPRPPVNGPEPAA